MSAAERPPATAPEIVAWLRRSRASDQDLAGMARYGIRPDNAFGVRMPELRRLARRLGSDHELAAELWAAGYRETRLLAGMVDDPALVTATQMDAWVRDFDSWDVCDGVCIDLFRRTPHAWRKGRQWSTARPGFTRRAGLTLIALLAKYDDAPDDAFLDLLPLVVTAAADERNEVRGELGAAQHRQAQRRAPPRGGGRRCPAAAADERSARWIASDALRELESPKVGARLGVAE